MGPSSRVFACLVSPQVLLICRVWGRHLENPINCISDCEFLTQERRGKQREHMRSTLAPFLQPAFCSSSHLVPVQAQTHPGKGPRPRALVWIALLLPSPSLIWGMGRLSLHQNIWCPFCFASKDTGMLRTGLELPLTDTHSLGVFFCLEYCK